MTPAAARLTPSSMDNHGALGWIVIALVCLAGCVAPLSAPSAFTGEKFLCDPEHLPEFDVLMEECRQARLRDQSCAGYVSFRATIDKQPVVVDAPAFLSNYSDYKNAENGVSGRDVFWAAFSPYFRVSLHVNLTRDVATGWLSDAFDGVNLDILNLEARGGNYFAVLNGAVRTIQFQAADELRVEFSAHISRGGSIEGCFDVFPVPL
jgi:hypothetical protein